MATIMTPRLPFGEIGLSRLQTLSATKNTQNAITDILAKSASGKANITMNKPTKRSFSPAIFDDESFDSENIDPMLQNAKKSKGSNGTPFKPARFTLDTTSNITMSDGLLSPLEMKSQTFKQNIGLKRSTTPPPQPMPRSIATAPAGRSPKHKRVGILSRKRTSLSPYRRIERPNFGTLASTQSSLPFSIDAALSGTLSTHKPDVSKVKVIPTIEESMPKGWFFDIHEDTPDDEAAIMMEHSTCIMDISSDDEQGPSRRLDRGKENIPPADHPVAAPISLEEAAAIPIKARRSTHADAMSDEDRAPLGVLPTEDFYGHGLDARSVAVITADHESKPADALEETSEQDEDVAVSSEEVLSPVDDAAQAPAAFTIAEDKDTGPA